MLPFKFENMPNILDNLPDRKILLCDLGDLIFSIFFKTLNIYKKKNNIEKNLDKDPDFLKFLTSQFFYTTRKLRKKYNVMFEDIFLIKDDCRENVWRTKYYDKYKTNRGTIVKHKKSELNVANIFKYVYKNIIHDIRKKFNVKLMSTKGAEADDIIAILVMQIFTKNKIVIISSDTDYLQLFKHDNVEIYGMDGKSLKYKLGEKDPKQKLYEKILWGDKTDNIGPIIPNKKKIKKYVENPGDFLWEIILDKQLFCAYLRNRILIDFQFIPNNIQKNIIFDFKKCIND